MNNAKYFISKQRILNFSKCQYLGEVHRIIQRELELPEWYGQNLDALWDSLTGIMYVPADVTIIYKPETKEGEELSSEIRKIISIFERAIIEYNEIILHIEM